MAMLHEMCKTMVERYHGNMI
ncbi:hypothetical protein F383_36402 [Gossypium arboreum]|uniref:Uncharacterized protein n=1 Tax=Gossypium arboreum TaxID=29729 RepID=A0A0B0Q2Z0_GOSAR|nr:hypothetical protein F383_36402 [Gossypium arboreum]